MKKNKRQKTVQETLSSVDAVLVALNSYPSLEDAILDRGQGEIDKFLGQFFPTQLDFIKELLEHLVGMDVLIDILSKFLTGALPGVEIGIKSALLANMQNLGTNCTIDPFIYEKAIKEGILFDLRQIDLYDKLTVSPLDKKIGQYYYFGIEDCESSYDVLWSAIDPNNQSEKRKAKNAKKGKEPKQETSYGNRAMNDSVGHYFGGKKRDFDCLLWYMKNKGISRQVWGKRTSINEGIFNGNGKIEEWIKKKGEKKAIYYEVPKEEGGDIKFYQRGKESSEDIEITEGEPKMLPLIEGNDYYFGFKGSYYKYSYGKPSISKLDKEKLYYVEEGEGKYKIYYYLEIWQTEVVENVPNYESIQNIPTDSTLPKQGDYIALGGNLYYVEEDAKTEIVQRGDTIRTVITNFKRTKCLNITNSLKENVYLFVDYDEVTESGKTKGDIIKNGDIPTSTLEESNVGTKKWYKSNVTDKTEITGIPDNCRTCYYADKDGDGKYTPNVDKILIPPYTKNGFCININDLNAKDNKYTKDFGIVTLEYSPRTGNIMQSDGKPMQQQTPYDNVLHVFFGNVKELSQERDAAETAWQNSSNVNKEAQKLLHTIANWHNVHLKSWKGKQKEWKKSKVDKIEQIQYNSVFNSAYKYYEAMVNGGTLNDSSGIRTYLASLPNGDTYRDINVLSNFVTSFNGLLERYGKLIYSELNKKGDKKDVTKTNNNNDITDWGEFNFTSFWKFKEEVDNLLTIDGSTYSLKAFTNRIADVMYENESTTYLKARSATYPEAEKNYYLKRTLFEFNADYINSLQLFDPKVLAAQLITSLFGSIAVNPFANVTPSWKSELIHDVVKDMVQKQIAAEDFAVSDCFFTFTNDAYNGMLRAAELRQAGLYSQHGEENGNSTIDPIKMLEGLNDVDNCADQAGQTEVIKGVIMNASGEICKDEYKENNEFSVNANYCIQMSFIETLMVNLCTQLVMAVLSPKVYLLILINLEMFGLSTNFDIKAFIERFQALIKSIVKSIVDQFMQYMTQEIMKIIEEVIQKLIQKLAFEQVEMYARLIKQILMHLRMLTSCGQSIGWSQDSVDYADIVNNEAGQEPIDEC